MFFLTSGFMHAPSWVFEPGGGWRRKILPMTVGVIERADGALVLVDAGFSAREVAEPKRAFGPITAWGLAAHGGVTEPSPDETPLCIADQLRARGLAPEAVKAIVATHLHVDHVGGFVDFPNAEVLATPAEIRSAGERGRTFGFVHIKALQQSGRLVPVELDAGERHGFPAWRDLFGDGRLVLLDAKGHTAGAVCVLMTDGADSVLHAGDAAYSAVEYREGRPSALARIARFRNDWLRATWGRIAAFEKEHPETRVVLAHDLDTFRMLPH